MKKAGQGKKAGQKAGNNVPRDFMVAQRTLNQLITDYSGIAPLTLVPKDPTIRDQIIEAVATRDTVKLRTLHAKQGAKFLQEVHKPGGKDAVLVFAASHGNADAVRFLLSLRVDPNQADESGQTALHTASGGGFTELLGMLVDAGACAWINDIAGNSPFFVAAVRGLEPVLLRLLDFNVNPWVRDGTDRPEITYISDEVLRQKVARKAYWLRHRGFLFILRSRFLSRLSFNLQHLVCFYL